MPITRQQKEQHVIEIKDLISKSNMIIVWDYLGLTASGISEIRTKLKEEKAVNKVYKNLIAKIAFKESGKEEILDSLSGPSSFLFIENADSSALSDLNKFIKENDNLSFKAGYIDGEFYDQEGITQIAGLPSKDVLLSMLLSALQGTMRNLAFVISQIAISLPADGSEKEVVQEVKEDIVEVKEDKLEIEEENNDSISKENISSEESTSEEQN